MFVGDVAQAFLLSESGVESQEESTLLPLDLPAEVQDRIPAPKPASMPVGEILRRCVEAEESASPFRAALRNAVAEREDLLSRASEMDRRGDSEEARYLRAEARDLDALRARIVRAEQEGTLEEIRPVAVGSSGRQRGWFQIAGRKTRRRPRLSIPRRDRTRTTPKARVERPLHPQYVEKSVVSRNRVASGHTTESWRVAANSDGYATRLPGVNRPGKSFRTDSAFVRPEVRRWADDALVVGARNRARGSFAPCV